MRDIFTRALFKHHYLVGEGNLTPEKIYPLLYGLADKFGIMITSGWENLSMSVADDIADSLGMDVPEPFYRGFPASVRRLSHDHLKFDQMVHYMATYGFGFRDEQHAHSVLEASMISELENVGKLSGWVALKEFKVISGKEVESILRDEIIDPLFKSSRPLNESDLTLALTYLDSHPDYIPKECASKDTAVKILVATRDGKWCEFLDLPDVIKVLDALCFADYGNTNLKKLNLRNQDRKFLTAVIRKLLRDTDVRKHQNQWKIWMECMEKRKIWKGLLYHIHFKPDWPCEREFVEHVRNNDLRSTYSHFEKAMAEWDPVAATDLLLRGKGQGAVLRNLDYILSKCRNMDDVSRVLHRIQPEKNPLILMQLVQKYSAPSSTAPRTFKFVKHGQLKVHPETAEYAEQHRTTGRNDLAQALVSVELNKMLDQDIRTDKKIWLDPDTDWSKIALPLQESASASGFGVLAKGTRIAIPDNLPVIRAFTYWEKVDDIDMSAFGMLDDGKVIEFSWRNAWTWNGGNSPVLFSGDQTSGWNGGSEYFDIHLDAVTKQYPKLRYMIFADNIYSSRYDRSLTFNTIKCKAGFMLRDEKTTGQIYEPKTVNTAFQLDGEGTFSYLFAIDVKTREMVWLNLAMSERVAVAATSDYNIAFLERYLYATEILNYERFFKAYGVVVDSVADADILVSDADLGELPESKTQIHSYDLEKVKALMEGR